MNKIPAAACAFFLLCSCAQVPAPQAQQPSDLTPVQAVLGAAENPDGVYGTFRMIVKHVGRQDGWLYLDSEEDYRDQRCLVVGIPRNLAVQLEQQIGGAPEAMLIGKELRVTGTAKRVTIWFYADGAKSDMYYYQTHVHVSDLWQLFFPTKT